MTPEQREPAPQASSPVGATPSAQDYSREAHAAWAEFLETLPRSARILDLGIGNHVVALIAADIASRHGRDWIIDSIDPRGQGPSTQPGYDQTRIDRINYRTGSTLARLPFDDASFDAVCGHHTLEFTDTASALAEVHRVLKPGGDAQFLMHHAESPLLEAARLSLREADLVFTQTKAFRRLHRLVTMSQIVPESTERATNDVRAAIRTLKRAVPVAQQHGGGRVLTVALDGIQKMLAARRELSPDAAGLAVDRAEAELRGSVRRLNDLTTHARGEPDMQQVEGEAAAVGFTRIERMPQLHAGNRVMAWQLLLHRP